MTPKNIRGNTRSPVTCLRGQRQWKSTTFKDRFHMVQIWIKWINNAASTSKIGIKNSTQRSMRRVWSFTSSFRSNKRNRISNKGRRIIKFYNCLIEKGYWRIVISYRSCIMCFRWILLSWGHRCFLRCWRSNKSRKRPYATTS